uniref:Uncharacterized protein n=1 Tax=Manihot esculenta TaxID=3983 RepID=A0A2C9W6K4_MANES
MKDQGVCRWNYVIRSLQHHAMNNVRSLAEAQPRIFYPFSSSSSSSSLAEAQTMNNILIFHCQITEVMKATRQAWIVAATFVAVEPLKDQGFCRSNFIVRSKKQWGVHFPDVVFLNICVYNDSTTMFEIAYL